MIMHIIKYAPEKKKKKKINMHQITLVVSFIWLRR